MVVTRIIGGLGNQMFQFAAGECLSRSWGTQHKLDITAFNTYKLHNGFQLNDLFKLNLEYSEQNEIASLKPMPRTGWLAKIENFLRPAPSYYLEKSFAFVPFPKPKNKCIYLDGYWQTEKYFGPSPEVVASFFEFRKPLHPRNAPYLESIQAVNSISIHVRRGDYVANPAASSYHGILGLDYYRSAIEKMKALVENPKFFVFSDDVDWCKANLPLKEVECVVVEGNFGADSWQDMQLMASCRCNIIANSSFSWWGAWLNKNSEKIIIAPKPWFLTKELDARDITPSGWLTLDPHFQSSTSNK